MVGIGVERLFRAPGQISVLRALWKAPAPLTGRQIQELAGVHNRTAMQCLDDLESLGLLTRRPVGRAYLYGLKRSHRVFRDLLDPIFKAEAAAPERFVRALGKVLGGQCLSAVLYGSVARGQGRPASDVDLLVVVADRSAGERFAAKTQNKAEQLVQTGWSRTLEVNVKTAGELARQWTSRLIKQIRKEGQLVAGRPLEEVRRGRRS